MIKNDWKSKPPLGAKLDPGSELSRGLVGLWLFNEGAGGKVHDLSDYGNHGTLTNMANPPTAISGWAPGRDGSAIAFDGSSAYCTVPDTDLFSFGDSAMDYPFSVNVLLKAQNIPGSMGIVGKYLYDTKKEWLLFVSSAKKLYIATLDQSTGAYIGRYYNTVIPEEQWMNISATYDGTKVVGGFKIYINGQRRDSNNYNSGTYTAMENTTQPLEIGRYVGAVAYYFSGFIANVSIYNRVLSESEVESIYEQPYQMIWKPRLIFSPTAATIYDETNKLQVVLAAQAETDNALRVETSKTQVILSAQTISDNAIANEVGKSQTILSVQDGTDSAIMEESGKSQLILTEQSQTDSAVGNEANKEQINLVAVFNIDSIIGSELSKTQINKIVLNETDLCVFQELYRSQNILVYILEIDTSASIYDELGRQQIILILTDGIGYKEIIQGILARVATSGRYGNAFDRQTVVATNGRYDKLIAAVIIIIEATKPFLRFTMKKPSLPLDMKKPNVKLVMK